MGRRALSGASEQALRAKRSSGLAFLAVGLAVLASRGSALAGATASRADGARSVRRCSFTGSPYGRIGVYLIKGRVGCDQAEFVIHRAFYASGTGIDTLSSTLFADRWICGGQMGSLHCQIPTYTNPSVEVEGLACHFGANLPGDHGSVRLPSARPTLQSVSTSAFLRAICFPGPRALLNARQFSSCPASTFA
jgi:hypothetical protein